MLSIKANRTFVFQLHSFHFWDGGVAKALFWYRNIKNTSLKEKLFRINSSNFCTLPILFMSDAVKLGDKELFGHHKIVH